MRGYREARHRVLERTVSGMQPVITQLGELHRSTQAAAGA
jgi:hypothetical protein